MEVGALLFAVFLPSATLYSNVRIFQAMSKDLSNNIFASKYATYMPDKEQLIAQVEAVLSSNDDTE